MGSYFTDDFSRCFIFSTSSFFWTAMREFPDCRDSSQGSVRRIHSNSWKKQKKLVKTLHLGGYKLKHWVEPVKVYKQLKNSTFNALTVSKGIRKTFVLSVYTVYHILEAQIGWTTALILTFKRNSWKFAVDFATYKVGVHAKCTKFCCGQKFFQELSMITESRWKDTLTPEDKICYLHRWRDVRILP